MSKKTTPNKKTNVTEKRTNKESCFVIMPFGGWLDDYYENIYCPAIKSAGLKPHRADDLYRPSTIIIDIWKYTQEAKILIADLTGKNANVFYELGLAHASGKPVILVAASMEDIPFDLRSLRIITYDKNAFNWGDLLKEQIEKSIKEVLSSPSSAILPAFLNIKPDTKQTVTTGEKEIIEIKQDLESLKREIRMSDRRANRSRIEPQEAESLIHDYIRQEMPISMILSRLTSLGAPEDWVKRRIDRYINERTDSESV